MQLNLCFPFPTLKKEEEKKKELQLYFLPVVWANDE